MDMGDAVMEVNQGIQGGPDLFKKPLPAAKPRPLPAPGQLGWALLFGLLFLVTWETGAALIQHMDAPTEVQWQSALADLKKHHKAGEPLIFAPDWVAPLGRLHFAEYVNLESATLSDVDRFRRVWVVSTRGARHAWLHGHQPVETYEHGTVSLDLYIKEAVEVTYDFTARIAEAQVERAGRTVTRCKLDGKRFTCPPHSWNWVGPHLAEVGHMPYRCVFAHAVDGDTMRITFPAVPLGRQVVGYTGIDDFENRKRNDAPVTLRVKIGEHTVGEAVHQNSWPWSRFHADTSRWAGQTHAVQFEITTTQAFARTFCFTAEARK
jgi:hypothetical protein